jgi:hypothetical protein
MKEAIDDQEEAKEAVNDEEVKGNRVNFIKTFDFGFL